MYTVITKVVYPFKEFDNKEDWKSFIVAKYVPEGADPLRVYNFKLMDKYGHHFFRLKFEKPHTGWLFHTYQTREEYLGSIDLRINQQEMFNKDGITYEIFYPES